MPRNLKLTPSFASQAGVTMLLAILVLSSLLAVSISVATIMFVEVRSSGDLLHSETSYYGADGAVEEGIYKIKRQVATSTCSSALPNCYSSSIGSVNLSSIPPVENALTDPVFQASISPGGSFTNNATYYSFYDPACPSPNPASTNSQCQLGGSGYSRVKVTYLSAGSSDSVFVYVCQFDPTYSVNETGQLLSHQYDSVPCSNPSNSEPYWVFSPYSGFPLNSTQNVYDSSVNGLPFDSTKQQELIIYDPNTGTNPPYIQVQAYDQYGNPKGVPYFEETAVDVNAQDAGVNRKVRAVVPNASVGR